MSLILVNTWVLKHELSEKSYGINCYDIGCIASIFRAIYQPGTSV